MSSQPLLLAIDQGTTSSRAIVFAADGMPVASAQAEFPQVFPRPGWVEHDPEAIWESTVRVCREAVGAAGESGGRIVCAGITNQRETTVIWDRASGEPIHNAIVWQDRRTSGACRQLREAGLEEDFAARTGLLLDPYFSGTKIAWLLDNVDGARRRAERGELAFGTIDTFLLWRLTGGEVHATDATNASRTLLFNIHENRWDEDLLGHLHVPAAVLPEVRDCVADFGEIGEDVLGRRISIGGVAGDQQAAAIGQACFRPGMLKSTYGTGCFALLNTGAEAVASRNRLLTTIGYRIGGKTSYALEGSIFIAGAALQWLRDGLGVIGSAPESEGLAAGLADNRGVYLVPAFAGLGAPWWDSEARGAVYGLTRDTGPAELARAALESVCYQTWDLLEAMESDGAHPAAVRVDGGMVENDWLMQFLADILGKPVQRPVTSETTALGAACLAGLHAGVHESLEAIEGLWTIDREFRPVVGASGRRSLLDGWRDAIRRTRSG